MVGNFQNFGNRIRDSDPVGNESNWTDNTGKKICALKHMNKQNNQETKILETKGNQKITLQHLNTFFNV